MAEKQSPPQTVRLDNVQKKALRRLGHDLSPLVTIGKEGLTEAVIEAVDEALAFHELIKVKLLNTAPISKQQATERIPPETGSVLVQLIGKTLLVYRPNPKLPKDKRIVLPAAKTPTKERSIS